LELSQRRLRLWIFESRFCITRQRWVNKQTKQKQMSEAAHDRHYQKNGMEAINLLFQSIWRIA
jgi:hypothetical protein